MKGTLILRSWNQLIKWIKTFLKIMSTPYKSIMNTPIKFHNNMFAKYANNLHTILKSALDVKHL